MAFTSASRNCILFIKKSTSLLIAAVFFTFSLVSQVAWVNCSDTNSAVFFNCSMQAAMSPVSVREANNGQTANNGQRRASSSSWAILRAIDSIPDLGIVLFWTACPTSSRHDRHTLTDFPDSYSLIHYFVVRPITSQQAPCIGWILRHSHLICHDSTRYEMKTYTHRVICCPLFMTYTNRVICCPLFKWSTR